jgi:hypothetical protein
MAVTSGRPTGVGMPGRSCPIAYRYSPEELATGAAFACETLYVVGGLYGNTVALKRVLERVEREVTQQVLAHHAIRGNVEAELAAAADDAGCGCAYPEYIDDATVARSNAIMARLRETARRFPKLISQLAGLLRHLTVEVGGERVGIVHGDPESLAGWRLALEAMEPGDPILRREIPRTGALTTASVVADWFRRADVRVFCSSHTGLPYAQDFLLDRRRHLVINNGAAGLANFRALRAASSRGSPAMTKPPATASTG